MTRTPTPSTHGRFVTALRAALGLDPRPDIWLRGPRPSLHPRRKPAKLPTTGGNVYSQERQEPDWADDPDHQPTPEPTDLMIYRPWFQVGEAEA